MYILAPPPATHESHTWRHPSFHRDEMQTVLRSAFFIREATAFCCVAFCPLARWFRGLRVQSIASVVKQKHLQNEGPAPAPCFCQFVFCVQARHFRACTFQRTMPVVKHKRIKVVVLCRRNVSFCRSASFVYTEPLLFTM